MELFVAMSPINKLMNNLKDVRYDTLRESWIIQ